MESADHKGLVQSARLPIETQGRSWTTGQKWRLGVGLALGALLLFCDWTDYSLAGTWADYVLPILGIVAGGLALQASKYVPHLAIRMAAKIVAVVALVEGAAAVAVVALLVMLSPMGMMLVAFNMTGEEQVSAVTSPDGTRVAEQYYIGADGMVIVRVKHRLMPLLERDLYRGGSISSEAVAWADNDTLVIPAAGRRMHLGLVRTKLAPPVQLGIDTWGFIRALEESSRDLEERRKRDEEMSRPLKTIPVYPGGTENDNSGANMVGESGFRAFDIKAPNSDEAAKWYEQVLSQGEWRVVETKRRETRGETAASRGEVRLVYNCIEAVRQEEDGTSKHYYWRFLWAEQSTHVRVIVETPEPPTVSQCDGP